MGGVSTTCTSQADLNAHGGSSSYLIGTREGHLPHSFTKKFRGVYSTYSSTDKTREKGMGESGDWWLVFTVLAVEGRVLLEMKEAATPSCRSSELLLVSAIQARSIVVPACFIQDLGFFHPGSWIQPKKRREKSNYKKSSV